MCQCPRCLLNHEDLVHLDTPPNIVCYRNEHGTDRKTPAPGFRPVYRQECDPCYLARVSAATREKTIAWKQKVLKDLV